MSDRVVIGLSITDQDLYNEIREFYQAGKKTRVCALLRTVTGYGLKGIKKFVDQFMGIGGPTQPLENYVQYKPQERRIKPESATEANKTSVTNLEQTIATQQDTITQLQEEVTELKGLLEIAKKQEADLREEQAETLLNLRKLEGVIAIIKLTTKDMYIDIDL